jgi:ketosteroid isomerase-like protein
MALWADDGVDLMPGTAPIVGKAAITKWLDDATANFKGYRVTTQEVDYHDIEVCGDWASEWGNTHQIVQPPDGKAPIEIFGKISLVLHKEKSGWRIKQEMWNASPK